MTVALTMFFAEAQGTRTAGWSETIVADVTSIFTATDPRNNLVNPLAKYVDLRCQMLGAGVIVNYMKLTNIFPGRPPVGPQRRAVLLVNPPEPFYPTTSQNPGEPALPYYNTNFAGNACDFSQLAYMQRLLSSIENPPFYSRTFWITGLPDIDTNTYLTRPQAGFFMQAYNKWSAYVIGGKFFQIKVNDRSGANPLLNPSAYDPTTGLFTFAAPHGMLDLQQVEAVNWRSAVNGPVPRGIYRVRVPDPTHFSLQGAALVLNYVNIGAFRPISYVFVNVNDLGERSFTNKKRGRVFGQLPGRRPRSRIKKA